MLFALGVFMLLARPFMVYQMCAAGEFSKDPQKVYSLLQRLIKKKDDHHAADTGEAAVLEPAKAKRLEASSFMVLFTRLFRLASFHRLFSKLHAGKPFVTAQPHLMICRFQI